MRAATAIARPVPSAPPFRPRVVRISADIMADDTPPSVIQPARESQSDWLTAIATRGDKEAFAALFAFFAPRVKSYLLNMNATSEVAEDVMQEVMVTVWQKAALYDENKAAASTWIFRIARNKYIDRIRRERPVEHAKDDELDQAPDTDLLPDDQLNARQVQQRVGEALKALPPEQAQIVRLSFLQGMAHGAIATHLDLPLGTVKSRLRLAFKRLRGELGDLR